MGKIIAFALAFVTVLLIAAVLGGIPVYFLWNWLCPKLFGLPVITFWEAVGMSALSAVLFKSASSSSSK